MNINRLFIFEYLNKFLQCFFYFIIFALFTGFNYINIEENKSKLCKCETIKISRGDNLIKLIEMHNKDKNDFPVLKQALYKQEYLKFLKEGKTISFFYQASFDNPILKAIIVDIGNDKIFQIQKKNNNFVIGIAPKFSKSFAKVSLKSSNINLNNLTKLLMSSGINEDNFELCSAINKINKIASNDGLTKIELILEKYSNFDNTIIIYGKVLYASLKSSMQIIELYKYYCPYDKIYKFYDKYGNAFFMNELIMPIEKARITSKFGMRHHPILKKPIMHNGIDIGASRGTKIYAASDGFVRFLGRKGGYGNYILIEHNNNIKTEYGHLLSFAQNIQKGSRIKKSQIIGYVGATGRATAPHLHYGIILNGKYVNPLNFKISKKNKLDPSQFKSFIAYKNLIHALSKKLGRRAEIASHRENKYNLLHK